MRYSRRASSVSVQSRCVPKYPGQVVYAAAEGTHVFWSEGQRYSPDLQAPQSSLMEQAPLPEQSGNSPRQLLPLEAALAADAVEPLTLRSSSSSAIAASKRHHVLVAESARPASGSTLAAARSDVKGVLPPGAGSGRPTSGGSGAG